MFVELQNVVEGCPLDWLNLDTTSKNGELPICQTLQLIRAQVRRAESPEFTKDLREVDARDNAEMIAFLKKQVDLDETANQFAQIPGARTWLKKLRSHLGLRQLGNPEDNFITSRLGILNRALALFPPEPKVYPSEQNKPS